MKLRGQKKIEYNPYLAGRAALYRPPSPSSSDRNNEEDSKPPAIKKQKKGTTEQNRIAAHSHVFIPPPSPDIVEIVTQRKRVTRKSQPTCLDFHCLTEEGFRSRYCDKDYIFCAGCKN